VSPPNVTLGDWISLMLLVNNHKLKMGAASTPGREYNRRSAVIESLRAGRSPIMPWSIGGMTADSPTTSRMSPLLPEQNVRPMFTCWVLCPVRVMSCHRISLKIRKRSLKKCTWTFCNETVNRNCCVWRAICFSAWRCTDSHESFCPKLALRQYRCFSPRNSDLLIAQI